MKKIVEIKKQFNQSTNQELQPKIISRNSQLQNSSTVLVSKDKDIGKSSNKELQPKTISRNSQLQKTSTPLENKDKDKTFKKENPENELDNKKVINIKMVVNNSKLIEEAQKELMLKLEKNTFKVNLHLKTYFADDQQLLKFTISLQKIAHQLTYFTWIIEGKFTDDGQAKCIGDFVSKLKNTYSLDLQLNFTFFADTGATYLSKGFKKLNNLHVLKFDLYPNYGVICKQITELGYQKIFDSIKCLPNLEIFDGGCLQEYVNETNQTLIQNQSFPKLQSLFHALNSGDQINDVKYILEKKQNVLTTIQFYLWKTEQQMQNLYENTLDIFQLIFNLPYLIEFYCIQDRYFKQIQDYKYLFIQEVNQIICDLCQTRAKQIRLILCFDQFIKSELIFNPYQVILDLYY